MSIIVKSCEKHEKLLTDLNKDSIRQEIKDTLKHYINRELEKINIINADRIHTEISSLDEKLLMDLGSLKIKLRDSVDNLTKEVAEIKQRANIVQKNVANEINALKEAINVAKDAVKNEIIAKHIKPDFEIFKMEFIDISRTLSAVEKQVKYVSYKQETYEENLNSKIADQKEEIKDIIKTLKNLNHRFDAVVESKTEELRESIKKHEEKIKADFETFYNFREAFFLQLEQNKMQIQDSYEQKLKEFEKISSNLFGMGDKLEENNQNLISKMDDLKKNFDFKAEKTRIEMERIALDCYRDAKDKLILAYRDDIKVIQKKLEWLPHDTDTIKDLPPFEARLFTLESRLRREENNRIVQKIEILKEIEDRSSHASFQNRSITPTNMMEAKTPCRIKFANSKLRTLDRGRFKTPDSLQIAPSPIIMKYPYV
ncbi:hypothetical protein SteCoe_7874 [Stentor coeruleus]|uniref:Uncharacterized protein n=1 Tax=Stentor coeruleus TaxID=5963 RepID=A0A1R2CLP8_9CILI|nr:hypothetical protein SteCoe_7874 [Stentor coeruleus]